MCFYISARHEERLDGEVVLENGKGDAKVSIEVTSTDGAILFERHASEIGKFSVVTPPSKYAPSYPRGGRGGHGQNNPGSGQDDDHELDYDEWGDDYEDGYEHYDSEEKYKACVVLTVDRNPDLHNRVQRAVTFRLHPANRSDRRVGVSRAAKTANVDSIAFSLDNIMRQMNGMVSDLAILQQREKKLVKQNRDTAGRLAKLTIVSLAVLILTAGFQFSHYRSFFASKKLC